MLSHKGRAVSSASLWQREAPFWSLWQAFSSFANFFSKGLGIQIGSSDLFGGVWNTWTSCWSLLLLVSQDCFTQTSWIKVKQGFFLLKALLILFFTALCAAGVAMCWRWTARTSACGVHGACCLHSPEGTGRSRQGSAQVGARSRQGEEKTTRDHLHHQ